MTRDGMALVLWALFVFAAVLSGFAVSAVWNAGGVTGDGGMKNANLGQHMAAVSYIAGPMVVASAVLLSAAVRLTRFQGSGELSRAKSPSALDSEDEEG